MSDFFVKKWVAGWWFWLVLLLVVTTIIAGGVRFLGLWGGTIAERVVFENSFQYNQARKTEQKTWAAALASIESRLTNPELTAYERAELEAQRSALQIQLQSD